MALNIGAVDDTDMKPKITVFGVGGAGGNAVNNMINKNLEGVEFVVANTDAQAIEQSRSSRRVQLGTGVTAGLGAGMKPSVGRESAEETIDEIIDHLNGANMCFITAGMGGGTGTGAAPVIAKAARELGVLTVGVVTKPFSFEGAKRMQLAEDGLDELQQYVDTLIIIPNQNLFRIATENTTIMDAFNLADDVLYQGVKGVTDLMVMPGLINLDFADVRTVMGEMGKAMMGTGEAEGEGRAVEAAEKAIANPLLDDVSLKGARGVLINITGGPDLKLFEVDEAASRIKQEVDPGANIIVGSCFDDSLKGHMRVSVVATGIEAESVVAARTSETARAGAAGGRPRRAIPAPRYASDSNSDRGIGAGTRHAVKQAVGSRSEPVEAAAPVEEYVEEPMAATGTDGIATHMSHGPVATVVDPSVAEKPATSTQAAAPQAPQPMAARSGLNLIRRVADSLGGRSSSAAGTAAAKPPFKGDSIDGNGSSDDDALQIPAFLRRQAN